MKDFNILNIWASQTEVILYKAMHSLKTLYGLQCSKEKESILTCLHLLLLEVSSWSLDIYSSGFVCEVCRCAYLQCVP